MFHVKLFLDRDAETQEDAGVLQQTRHQAPE